MINNKSSTNLVNHLIFPIISGFEEIIKQVNMVASTARSIDESESRNWNIFDECTTKFCVFIVRELLFKEIEILFKLLVNAIASNLLENSYVSFK